MTISAIVPANADVLGEEEGQEKEGQEMPFLHQKMKGG